MLILEELDYKKLLVDPETFKVAIELVFLYRFKVFTGDGLIFSDPSYVFKFLN